MRRKRKGNDMTRAYAAVAAAFIVGLLGVLTFFVLTGRRGDDFAQCSQTQVAGGTAAIGGPFQLVNGKGAAVTADQVLTRPALVYFGYTFCPDVCPFDMARNAEAVDLLKSRGIDVTPVFITVDPARDTPEVVDEWATAMHPDAVGLTGTPEQILAAAQAYKVFFSVPDHGPEDEFYTVDHSTFTYLMLPGRGFAEFFRRETTAEQMAETVACFVASV
jgi:protein SCO1